MSDQSDLFGLPTHPIIPPDLADRSGLLRLYRKLGLHPHHDDHTAWLWRSHWYVVLNDGVRMDMERLGREFRDSGDDLRTHPIWSVLEFQDCYLEAFEQDRKVLLQDLTPRAIYECLTCKNRLLWNGWEVQVGEADEITDGYGLPAWEHLVCVVAPDKATEAFSGLWKHTARSIYQHMTGRAFEGDDTLGHDPRHRYEPNYGIDHDPYAEACL